MLIEANLEKNSSKRIVALRAGETASLIGHGKPLEAITVLDFRNEKHGCGEGHSAGVGIKWIGGQRIIKTFPSSAYKIVPTNKGQMLADMEQRSISLIDLNSSQKRSIVSFAEKQIPLYLRLAPMLFISYRLEQHELLLYEGQDKEPRKILKLKKGMRLVQQGDRFGTVTNSEDGKSLEVTQIKSWSGESFRKFDIKLPEGMHSSRVGVAIDFSSGLNLVFGATPSLRKEMRQIFISNIEKGPRERIVKAQEGQYFSQAVLAPYTGKIVILSRNLQDESVRSLLLFNPLGGELRRIAIDSAEAAVTSGEKKSNNPQDKTPEKNEEKLNKNLGVPAPGG